mmetsp:Transcript_1196/g.1579  ORF Transcript_1196/g.1579 Transcript_1196/m.1579 type:complete len:92 (+) Transcript_1196:636-911(+)
MEFYYAKQMLLEKEHEIIKSRIAKLQSLPIGYDAYKEDLALFVKEESGSGTTKGMEYSGSSGRGRMMATMMMPPSSSSSGGMKRDKSYGFK